MVAQVCDRYVLSDRSAATITSAVLQDVGLISESHKDKIIDGSKIRRAQIKKRKNMQKTCQGKLI